MNDAQVKSKIANIEVGKHSVDDNLYLRVYKSGKASWIFRYTHAGKRQEYTIDKVGKTPKGISLKQAKLEAASLTRSVREGQDPKAIRNDAKNTRMVTVNDVAKDWLIERRQNLENPQIPVRVYENEIAPYIGSLPVDQITTKDILGIVRRVNDSGRPTVSNDALTHCKQLFTHAIILGVIENSPAAPLSPKHAGGKEPSRTRTLSFEEISTVLKVMRDNAQLFTRDNYLAICLFLCLGTRKTELTAAKWHEFDFNKQIFSLPEERTKKNAPGLEIPLPDEVIPIFEELKIRSCGSEYVFPARRASKRRGYISDDTLNHALQTLFGVPSDSQKKRGYIPPNLLGEEGIEHFTIHDLRRTCRSRLSELRVPSNVAEKCINHKIKGVEGVYDRWEYFEERKEALCKLAKVLQPLW